MEPHGYQLFQITATLCRHKTCPINFILVVENFGVKREGKNHALHIKDALK